MQASSGSPTPRRRQNEPLRSVLASAASCAALALGTPALAQQSAEGAEPDAAPSTVSSAGSASVEPEALQLLEQAKRLYASARYAEALDVFERVYALEPNPAVLFNIGAVHAALHHCELARDAYRLYIESTRLESGRADAQQQLERLSECDAAPAAVGPAPAPSEAAVQPAPPEALPAVSSAATVSAAAGTAAPPPPASVPVHDVPPPMATDASPNAMRIAGWVAIGTGGVLGLASLGCAYASGRADEADGSASPGQSGDAAAREQHAGERYNALAWGLGGGAIAVAGSGLLMLWLQPDEQTSLQVATAGGGLGLSLERRF
jgi:hypothetical protein